MYFTVQIYYNTNNKITNNKKNIKISKKIQLQEQTSKADKITHGCVK